MLNKFIESANKIAAISNYKYSKDIEEFTKNYDIVIRFNNGSNTITLKDKLGRNFNNRNDICVLSGWQGVGGFFGNLNGYTNKTILFSRPKCVNGIKYKYKKICVQQSFEDNIKKYTKDINYIPLQVFYDFYDEYNYDHPTTGLITTYYICKYFNKKIDVINFFIEQNNLHNTFLNVMYNYTHDISKESFILNSFNVNRIVI